MQKFLLSLLLSCLLFSKTILAKENIPFSSETKKLIYQQKCLPDELIANREKRWNTQYCVTVDANIVQTNQKWINQRLYQQAFNLIYLHFFDPLGELSLEERMKYINESEDKPFSIQEHNAEHNRIYKKLENLAQLTELIQRFFDEEYQDKLHRIKNDMGIMESAYRLDIRYLGQFKQLVMFEYESEIEIGSIGGFNRYFVFDLEKQQEVKLDDVLLPTGKQKLYQLVNKAYDEYTVKEFKEHYSHSDRYTNITEPKDILEHHKQTYSANAETDNFVLVKKGIKLGYPAPQLSSFVTGTVEITIDEEDIHEILKPEYIWSE